jgi:hypothetical protein
MLLGTAATYGNRRWGKRAFGAQPFGVIDAAATKCHASVNDRQPKQAACERLQACVDQNK